MAKAKLIVIGKTVVLTFEANNAKFRQKLDLDQARSLYVSLGVVLGLLRKDALKKRYLEILQGHWPDD